MELSLDGLLVGVGLYHPASDQLARYRAAIDDGRRAASFERALGAADTRASSRPALAQTGAARLPAGPSAHRPPAHARADRLLPARDRARLHRPAADRRVREQFEAAAPLVRGCASTSARA